MTNLKSRIFYLFLFIFLIVGSITSLNVGISHDEWHEEENWKYNVALSKNIKNHIISNEKLDEDLENYRNSKLFKDTWAKTKPLFLKPAEAWSTERIAHLP